MKIDWPNMEWTILGEDTGWVQLSDGAWAEPWDSLSPEVQVMATAYAWDRWVIESCLERNGHHSWWVDWDSEDGLWLHCRYCTADVNELFPDGQDLMEGELPLPDGEKLIITFGGIDSDVVREWHGPVRAEVWSERYRSSYYGTDEYNAGITVEAA